jgi:hypothetical protein
MKKEYLILIVLIAALSAYLFLKKDNQVHYELPVPAALETADITRVDITKNNTTITLTRGEENWTVAEAGYPVDKSAVDRVLDALKEVKLSALVSEAGDLVRYDLDPENGVTVTAFGKDKDKEVRRLIVGKAAPSFNHTFIMLDDGKAVYQADGSFRNDFDKTVDDFRDKVVMDFQTEGIKQITLSKAGVTRTLVFKEEAVDQEADKKEDNEDTAADAGTPKGKWQFEDDTEADNAVAGDLLSSLSHLEAQSFLADDAAAAMKADTPVCRISLKNDGDLGVDLFEQKGGEDTALAGLSTAVPYAFTLASYKTEDILSYVDKLLGIEAKEETEAVKE